MGQEQQDESKSEGQPASMNTQNSMTEKEENFVEVCAEMEEKGKEKGMEEGEMKKEMELEAEVTVELSQTVSAQQMSFIRGSDLFGYVGIEAVLDQMRRKTMKAGFEFNIMVVGESHPHTHRQGLIIITINITGHHGGAVVSNVTSEQNGSFSN